MAKARENNTWRAGAELKKEGAMFVLILIVLLAVMWVISFRASELYKVTRARKDDPALSAAQVQTWYNMGGFNLLLLNNEPNAFISFLAGLSVWVAYGGLWMCAFGKWAGIALVIGGALVCALTQLGLVKRIKDFFESYQEETGEDPKTIFTGKISLGHAVYTSIKIGIARALSVAMICSIVGIMLYFFSKMMGRNIVYREEMIENEEGEDNLIDEQGNRWYCRYHLGDDVRVYRDELHGKEIYIRTDDLIEALDKAKYIQIGNKVFHRE